MGYDTNKQPPNDKNPFGNPPFPGDTYAGGPNWLGYLVLKNQKSRLYIYDYAVNGHTVPRMKGQQVKDEFMEHAGKKPDYCPWESDNSLFSISFDVKCGIYTDCSFVDWNQ
jgi:hypothetical protein